MQKDIALLKQDSCFWTIWTSNPITLLVYIIYILKWHIVILSIAVLLENPDKQTLGTSCLILKLYSSLDSPQFLWVLKLHFMA